jgi:acetyltransferase
MITIEQAQPCQAPDIARLIMEAMNHECCLYFAGEEHGLSGFHQLVSDLVCRADSQYSYLNTLVALNAQRDVVGVCTAYDGARLHQLRLAFVEGCLARFNRDFGNMDDETAAGELYVDSLAVDVRYRGKGIAKALLRATIEKAKQLQLPAVGLLVDKGNPKAERLYTSVGFQYVDDNQWGGHAMRHLQCVLGVE